MIVNIEIECETIDEFGTHLHVILTTLNKKAKRAKLNFYQDEIPISMDLNDDNCYGSHTVTIKSE